ncbi:MAG: LysR family transcriptional regulator [Myxococcota bacterium]
MRGVELSSLDLNLLVVLEALLLERHVTRAAKRLALSQPAVSRGLARLREIFDDELLTRIGGRMERTPRANELLEPLQDALRNVREMLTPRNFDPARATGTVRMAAPDIVTYMLVPALLRRMAVVAPGLNLEIVQWSQNWREHLESGDLDLTFGQATPRDAGFYSQLLMRNEWACVLRRGHPALKKPWTLDSYVQLSHLLIGFSSQGGGQVDAALAALGRKRRITLRMPYVVLSPLIVAETDLVLTTARWLAEKLAAAGDLVLKSPPVSLEPVDIPMVWHQRSHRDPRQQWLRASLRRLAQEARLIPASHARRA